MPFEPPQWIKPDHSANIYPAALSRRLAAKFRLSITLNEIIDPPCLQQTLEETIRRIPSFQYRLKQGGFWFYFEKQEGSPVSSVAKERMMAASSSACFFRDALKRER